MNRPFASPLTLALSPGGGEGEQRRANGWFMGSGHVSGTWRLSMNRPFASPLTPALSPGGGEGDHGRAHGGFMGSGHVRGAWKLPMNRAPRLGRDAFHRVPDFS